MSNLDSSSSADLQAKLAALNEEVTTEFEARKSAETQSREASTPAFARPRAFVRSGRSAAMWITMVAGIGLLVVLPFATLIGGAVWLYRGRPCPPGSR